MTGYFDLEEIMMVVSLEDVLYGHFALHSWTFLLQLLL